MTALKIAAQRFNHFGMKKKSVLVACDDYSALPFSTNAFDLITLSFPVSESGSSLPLRSILEEARRLLKPDGQLVLIGENKNSKNPRKLPNLITSTHRSQSSRRVRPDIVTGYSFYGYKKILKRERFTAQRTLGLLRAYSFLHRLSPLEGIPNVRRKPLSGSLKDRIKESRFMAPAFAFITGPRADRSGSILDSMFSRIGEQFNITTSDIQVSGITISRKEKLIIRAAAGERNFILRVPLNPAALQSERTNAAMLEYLLKNRGNATITFPRPLIQGTIGPFQYFVESFVVGTPLSGVFKATDPKAMIRSVVSLLGQLNPEPDAADTILLADAEYARQIGQRIEKLKLAINDPNMIDGISGYFSSRLKGVRLPAGVLHGDFSASNILTSRREVSGLIDWEGGSNTGLAILDAITFVDSTYRLLSGKMVSVTIPNLASGHFVDPAYEEFLMQQYDRWHIDSDHHEALVYLKWLRHISYLLDFWLVYDERAIKHFILSVANSLLRRK